MSRPRFDPNLPGASLANVVCETLPSEATKRGQRTVGDRVQSIATVKSLAWGQKICASDDLISAALDATGEHVHAAKFVLAMAAQRGALAAAGGPGAFSGTLQLQGDEIGQAGAGRNVQGAAHV